MRPQRGRRPENRPNRVKNAENWRQIQCWFRHVNTHASTRALAGVLQTFLNAVRYSSWDSFRNASPVWATAHPNIPNHKIYYCFNSNFCNYAPTAGVAARTAIIQRANQIRLLGADYTATSSWRWALVAEPGQPAQRGIYRCDTFVADSFWHSAGYNWGYYVPSAWSTRMNDLLYSANILPTYVWNKLKN